MYLGVLHKSRGRYQDNPEGPPADRFLHARTTPGATLPDVAGQDNAQLVGDARVEVVALDIFEIACRTGESVTRRMVDRELERLSSHPPDCRCSEPCGLAREVSPSRTFWTARTWQNSITVRSVRRHDRHPARPIRTTHPSRAPSGRAGGDLVPDPERREYPEV